MTEYCAFCGLWGGGLRAEWEKVLDRATKPWWVQSVPSRDLLASISAPEAARRLFLRPPVSSFPLASCLVHTADLPS